ncbi:F-box protein At3g07870-like [Papaver somniferum]|uniref:F-box protein At3g07870-like n=1 Tax=Papaver somniferum TaxID=3469 RepID=UPI000E6F74A5|nr:F-box protein At3g07870-like [Papaver somniferum]
MHFHHFSNHHDSGKLGFIALTLIGSLDQKLHYLEYNQDHNELTEPIVRRRIRYNPPFERPEFAGSCNGLVCLSLPSYIVPFLIFNPIIRECVELPFIEIDCEKIDREDKRKFYCASGFGYVSSTDEYKVVEVLHKTKFYYVYIYTLGSGNGWRKLGTFDQKSADIWSEGTYANECVYWRRSKSLLVMTFDLAAETFRDHLSPPSLSSEGYWHRIGVLDGVLFFAVEIYVSGVGGCYDVWLLRKKNNKHDEIEQGAHQSWVWSKDMIKGLRMGACKFITRLLLSVAVSI